MQLDLVRRELAEKLNSSLEARLLCEIAFGLTASDFITRFTQEFDGNLVYPLLERRLKGEPIQRIKGSAEFYGLEFMLNEATLIPRADTETLVDEALKCLKPSAHILDLGTGTGCIIISILHHTKTGTGVACDISNLALEAASLNAKAHTVEARLKLYHSHWFDALEGQFDLIVANPPYIAFEEAKDLSLDVLNHDPHAALFADTNGLADYKAIFSKARAFLKPHGKILVEIGYKQARSVQAVAEKNGFVFESLTLDLANNPRVLTFS